MINKLKPSSNESIDRQLQELRDKLNEIIHYINKDKIVDYITVSYNQLNRDDKIAIHGVLFQLDILEYGDNDKVEPFYNKLPENIIKNGIHYGFDDFFVTSEMYKFFDENR